MRFSGDLGFEALEGQSPPTARINELKDLVKEALQVGPMERKVLVALRPADETLMDKALKQLVQAGNVVQPKRGVYELVVSSDPPSLGEEEVQKPND